MRPGQTSVLAMTTARVPWLTRSVVRVRLMVSAAAGAWRAAEPGSARGCGRWWGDRYSSRWIFDGFVVVEVWPRACGVPAPAGAVRLVQAPR